MSLIPTARHIREDRQDRELIIVIPKNQRIVPKQKETKYDDQPARRARAAEIQPPINTDFHRYRKKKAPVFNVQLLSRAGLEARVRVSDGAQLSVFHL